MLLVIVGERPSALRGAACTREEASAAAKVLLAELLRLCANDGSRLGESAEGEAGVAMEIACSCMASDALVSPSMCTAES
mmetsp:Transcript_73852/g.128246  ORF Transcript_73852/g.128246 Transcript_73852/m.128246 type:complete len:80 (+) Transcript_73852:259-498(+)